MERSKGLLAISLIISVACIAQKTDGFILGVGTNLSVPLKKHPKTPAIGYGTFGYGVDMAIEYKPKYIPPKSFFDFNILNDLNYTLSVEYMVFPGRDSNVFNQTIERRTNHIVVILLGMKAVEEGKYTSIQLGCVFSKYSVNSNAFACALNWGILQRRTDLSLQLQGGIKENTSFGFFIGIRAGYNFGWFQER